MSRISSVYYTLKQLRKARFNSNNLEDKQMPRRNLYAFVKSFDLVTQKLYFIIVHENVMGSNWLKFIWEQKKQSRNLKNLIPPKTYISNKKLNFSYKKPLTKEFQMKRILFVLALMLALTVCFVGQAFALNYPYGDIRNNDPDGGDDHPWGGDEIGTVPPGVSKYSGTTFSTGIIVVDLFFKYIIIEKIEYINDRIEVKDSRTTGNIEFRKYSSLEDEGLRK